MARFRIDSTDSDCNVSAERWRNSRVEEDSSLEGCWFRELNRRFAIPVAFPSICAAAGLTMSENRLTDVVRVLFLGRNRELGRLALFGLNRLPRALAAIRGVVGFWAQLFVGAQDARTGSTPRPALLRRFIRVAAHQLGWA